MGPSPSLVQELTSHTATLLVLVSILSGLVGTGLGAGIVWAFRRINRIETRQSELREGVLPEYLKKDDLKELIEIFKTVAEGFVNRVEDFMTNCAEGKCVLARIIASKLNIDPKNLGGPHV
jgi:hypothetical protein